MALDILTATYGGIHAILHTECCIYVTDHYHISQALSGLSQEIQEVQQLTGDPLQQWWASLTSIWL